MFTRSDVPEPTKDAVRRVYAYMGEATVALRLRPSFILVGAQRCGTTSLFRALMAHPQVVRPAFHKGINYFDVNYPRGLRWYLGHFPVTSIARRKTASHGLPVTFEASGYYLYHPFALERMARDLPGIKLVAMLRDPVERAFSAYKHEYARGFEQEAFETALELEDDRLAGEDDRMRDDPMYQSYPHRHHSYRHRGHYADQLERAFELFPGNQVHIIDSETYFEHPGQEYRNLLTFLELQPFEPPSFGRRNARPSPPMRPETRDALKDYYAPHDERLTKLLGRPLRWTS
jgi:Sulfotransferase domain